MKIPHTINYNFFKVFEPSKAALDLIPDSSRILKSENRTWDESHPPKLTEIALAEMANDFANREIINLSGLPCWERNELLEILPLDIPLPLAVARIEDEIYWMRRVKERWMNESHHCQDYGLNWKRMYLEKHVQEAVEAMTPEGYDLEAIENLCKLTRNYVTTLNLREVQVRKFYVESEEDDFEAEMNFYPPISEHLNLEPVISGLVNLTEIHVRFGLRNVGSGYEERFFQISGNDCRNLGNGIAKSQKIKLLRVHSCDLGDYQVIALLSSMEKNKSLETLDFSYCVLADDGASAIARFMKNREKLKFLNLSNNKIGEIGISAIAFMITQTNASPIENLNLKSNSFGDEGFKFLASALVREKTVVKNLNVSCCDLTEESEIFLGEVLNRNEILLEIDFSNNFLGENGGRALESALENNKTIQFLDVRSTGLPDETVSNIEKFLHLNRIRSIRGEFGVQKEIRAIQRREEEEEEKLRLEKLAMEEARATEEKARLEAEALAKLAAEKEDED